VQGMGSLPGSGEPEQTWKIGALARSTGLTVRALHHYDHIGLLTPSGRTDAGHRVYRLAMSPGCIGSACYAASGSRWGRSPLCSTIRNGSCRLRCSGIWPTPGAGPPRRRACVLAWAKLAAELDRRHDPSPGQLLSALEEMSMLDGVVHSTTSLLVYDDLAAAHQYLVHVYGLDAGPVTRDADGRVVHAEVRAGDQVIWRHPAAQGYQSPGSVGAVTSMTVVAVDDADAHHARAVQAGADIIEEPIDQPYGVREYGARDLEGQLWHFQSALER
jgi:MerR family transcriptional regulator, thiopeptide resistance regulator